ncbi:GntR family transcriptional regulator [Galbitalea soli]|uniref:GntR family transcriptional regulator n=1 Tax=Galbitalea soli TaxID=1268042 RepID=A0A7C9PNP9_9MICO|nr:GntR family transcriptional regulator [Galbitalea soli]NEM91568.1 GntR family transcriptional regulator [Galbitalea soli]NYJ30262.1 DNA-binding GntR family transcriptional regulator [Galbitalea soli]
MTDLDPEASLHGRLRASILGLDLAPGQRLSERGLEPELGASRTPIRAALMRLESEGLVRRDGRGWLVAPIDLDEIAQIAEFRELVETGAVRLALPRARREDLLALADLADSADETGTPEHSLHTGTSFHLELAHLAENAELFAALQGILTRLFRTRWLEVQSTESRERVRREHSAIAAALLAGDADAAERALLEHLRGTHDRLALALGSRRREFAARGIPIDGAGLASR